MTIGSLLIAEPLTTPCDCRKVRGSAEAANPSVRGAVDSEAGFVGYSLPSTPKAFMLVDSLSTIALSYSPFPQHKTRGTPFPRNKDSESVFIIRVHVYLYCHV